MVHRWSLVKSSVVMMMMLLLTACQPVPLQPTPAQEPQASQPGEAAPETVSGADEAVPPTQVKVVILPYISFAPFFIAQEEGYFQEQGLDVELVTLVQSQEATAALVSGEVDVSAGLMTAGLLNSMARGANLRVVADKGYIDPQGCANIALIARKSLVESGAELNADTLRGLQINNVPGSWNEYYTDKLLATIGLTLDDIVDVYFPSPGQLEALNQDTLDMVVNNEPWVTRFRDGGHSAILTPVNELLPQSQSAVTLYGSRLLEDELDAGNRFMVAYLQAVEQYNQGPTDRNREILLKYMQLEPELLQRMCWPTIRADGSLDHASILDFQDWAMKRGLVEQALPVEDIVDERFLEHANQVLQSAGQ